MIYESIELTQIGEEPLTATDASNYLRIDTADTNDSDLVSALCTASRQAAELFLNRKIVGYTVTMNLDRFPNVGIKLPIGPVQSTAPTINVTDDTNTTTVWDSSNYLFDAAGERIVYADGCTFPTTYAQINAVQVVYTAGWTTEDSTTGVPNNVLQAMRHMVAMSFENRETAVDLNPLIQALLTPSKKMVI